uniref:Uncharacterized protein n=1 Tax=uncultured marine microorganism HF4000_APKG2J17 TaxID=455546 RepID=B3T6L6_9ZZZZ|nr:hypothetical protein ALOHA_HF4000APKG2J17ctg1g32 [uncultured marine microorganism HF4000_APKG2J17]
MFGNCDRYKSIEGLIIAAIVSWSIFFPCCANLLTIPAADFKFTEAASNSAAKERARSLDAFCRCRISRSISELYQPAKSLTY